MTFEEASSGWLLVFELGEDSDELFIHGDPQGLRRLAGLLEKLAVAAEQGQFPHEHIFTEEWGGGELSSRPQESQHHCLNHVKLYGWTDARGAIPYKAKVA